LGLKDVASSAEEMMAADMSCGMDEDIVGASIYRGQGRFWR